jgi:hypothetical protein
VPTRFALPLLPTFSFHENGQGKLLNPFWEQSPLSRHSRSGPGGLLSALAFTAHPLVNPLVVGDVVLRDASGHVSDILRFDDPGPNFTPGSPQLIFFYSNDQGGLMGDTGLPSMMLPNTVTIQEAPSGPTIYTPGLGQPGRSTDSDLGNSFLIFHTDTGSRLMPGRGHCGARASLEMSRTRRTMRNHQLTTRGAPEVKTETRRQQSFST